MATDLPLTIWSPPDNSGEYVASGATTLIDASDFELADAGGFVLASAEVEYIALAQTVYTEDDAI